MMESGATMMENTINFAKQKTSSEASQHFMLQKLEQDLFYLDDCHWQNPQPTYLGAVKFNVPRQILTKNVFIMVCHFIKHFQTANLVTKSLHTKINLQ